jgi:hypothetical protein
MRALVHAVISKLAVLITRPRERSDFVCGECERLERCGLPPDKRCIVMVAQIARNGGRSRSYASLPMC